MSKHPQIKCEMTSLGSNFYIGENSSILSNSVTIGDNVRIGNNVNITCDELHIDDNSSIGNDTTFLSPSIHLAKKCRIGNNFSASLNQYFKMGDFSAIGHRVALAGQGFECGELLWLKNDIILGGGGSQGPNSFLTIGNRASIFDRSYVNLSERVIIGDDTALSYNVVLLTHGAWQPALDGYATSFGPITVGNNSVVYLNSVVMPGVSIGHNSTIGANATVMIDVPDNALAVGSPARIVKSEGYPRSLGDKGSRDLLLEVLKDYFDTLELKGALIIEPFSHVTGFGVATFEDITYKLSIIEARVFPQGSDSTITIGRGEYTQSQTHFDIENMRMSGENSVIAEDLRDYMRRRAIKFFNGGPFRSLPLSNINRLRQKRAQAKS